ncbi:transposable element Tcb2 transposase [Trichonephila clavipes]|nr:transposable element Tcb2 transposase [Trichonephila clavipes]
MQSDCALSITNRGRLMSFSVEYKTIKTNACLSVLNRLQRAEVDIPLHRFRRQYEQLSQFERENIIGIMEAGWSARQVARQLGRSDCAIRRCWDQWIRDMSLTGRPGSGHSLQISRREERRIVRNARVQPTASSTAIQAHVALSLGTPVSSRTI